MLNVIYFRYQNPKTHFQICVSACIDGNIQDVPYACSELKYEDVDNIFASPTHIQDIHVFEFRLIGHYIEVCL